MTSLCHKSMQALHLVALVVLAVSGIANGYANGHFATIFESGLPYKEQSWFYSGELDQDKIKKYCTFLLISQTICVIINESTVILYLRRRTYGSL